MFNLFNVVLYVSVSEETKQLLEAFQSDQLYVRLCRAQECFRARLTPKYWRCDVPKPPQCFPFDDPTDEANYRAWEQTYHATIDNYSTCILVFTYGVQEILPEVEPMINLHDQYTCRPKPDLA